MAATPASHFDGALRGLRITQLAAFQLEHIPTVWESFFAGSTDDPRNGTEEIITSSVAKAWPVSDAAVGAYTYMLEILTGIVGSNARWRTMPWRVILFGLMIAPLGKTSIFFIIIQPACRHRYMEHDRAVWRCNDPDPDSLFAR